MFPILSLLVACSADYAHNQDISTSEALPDLDELCTPDGDDVERDNGTRVFTSVEAVDGGCRASLYARVVAADWAEVDKAIDEASPTKTSVSWPEASVELRRLWVDGTDGATPPAGTRVMVEQLLSTDSAEQASYDADPLVLVDRLNAGELAGSSAHFLGFDYTLTGDEADNLDAPLLPQAAGAIDLLNQSYDKDDSLYLVTVASVIVPLDVLEEIGGTELAVQIEESMEAVAKIGLDWL